MFDESPTGVRIHHGGYRPAVDGDPTSPQYVVCCRGPHQNASDHSLISSSFLSFTRTLYTPSPLPPPLAPSFSPSSPRPSYFLLIIYIYFAYSSPFNLPFLFALQTRRGFLITTEVAPPLSPLLFLRPPSPPPLKKK